MTILSSKIEDARILKGTLPKRAIALVSEWAQMHSAELLRNWALCAARQAPNAIAPLED